MLEDIYARIEVELCRQYSLARPPDAGALNGHRAH